MKEFKLTEAHFIEKVINCNFRNLSKRLDHLTPIIRKRVSDWEELDDHEILETFSLNDYLNGIVYLINDASFSYDVFFEFDSSLIPNLENIYPDKYRGGIFNGDTIFISLERNYLVNFHHEGYWFLYKTEQLS